MTMLLDDVRSLADRGRSSELVAMLLESAPIHERRRTDEVDRMRAAIFGAFGTHGLPPEALPFILEELESGGNPQTVAAAAKALRNSTVLPAEAPRLLIQAFDRFVHADDIIEDSDGDCQEPMSLLSELLRTLVRTSSTAPADCLTALRSVTDRNMRSLSGAVRADLRIAIDSLTRGPSKDGSCCSAEPPASDDPPNSIGRLAPPTDLVLQDQDGTFVTFGTLLGGRPSVIAFFYTRCMVPQKCSLTITKLARMQQTIAGLDLWDRINVAAITYDPQYDLPSRLRSYGLDRGMTFDQHNRLLRAPRDMATLQDWFGLQVGFGPVTVNRHRLELFVLDRIGRIAASYTRIQWDEKKILETLSRLQIS